VVLLTGANGYLGRFLCLEWLERLDRVDGRLICLVRGADEAAALARLEAAFDSGDPELVRRFKELAQRRLTVVAGDIGEPGLGLAAATWRRLAAEVEHIVHPAALRSCGSRSPSGASRSTSCPRSPSPRRYPPTGSSRTATSA